MNSSNLVKRNCISEVVRIGSIIIFHLSKLWKANFFIRCGVIFLVRLQGKFEVDRSWEWGVNRLVPRENHYVSDRFPRPQGKFEIGHSWSLRIVFQAYSIQSDHQCGNEYLRGYSRTFKAGLHVRRKHKRKHKHKPRMNRDDASTTSASTRKRSAFLFLVLAPSRFTGGLCLCLRRTCKPAFRLTEINLKVGRLVR